MVTAAAAQVPDVIPGSGTPYPSWIAAEAALTETRALRMDLFDEYHANRYRSLARKNSEAIAKTNADPESCQYGQGQPVVCDFKPKNTLEDLVTHAEAIVSGEVVAAREGFHLLQPGTLLLLAARHLKGAPAPFVYLFFPSARIATADGLLCVIPPRGTTVPRVGDRVLVFAMYEPRVESGHAIFDVDVTRQLVHESCGRTYTPKALCAYATSAAPFDAVEGAVVAALSSSVATAPNPRKTRTGPSWEKIATGAVHDVYFAAAPP